MTTALPRREDVPLASTWDLASMYATHAEWEAEYAAIESEISAFAAFAGKLTRSAKSLNEWMIKNEQVLPKLAALVAYAYMQSDSDTANQANAALVSRGFGLVARVRAAMAFAEPELLKLAPEKLAAMMEKQPKLKGFQQYLDNLQRQKAHVLSAEIEQTMAQAMDALNMPSQAYGVLTDAEMKFAPAKDAQGNEVLVEQGNLDELVSSPDRVLRKSAWESFADAHLGLRNTIATIYSGKIKGSIFNARVRSYNSTLEASLFGNNIPVEVYENVIDSCNRNLPIWHRYWDIRRRALKLDKGESCDIFAPLSKPQRLTYPEAVEIICDGMAPLGGEYVDAVRAGCTVDRWVDVYPNMGKRSGAYSSGAYTSRPFILMSFSESAGLSSMSTLAHELGHSMHTYLANKNQRYTFADYSLFVAEVASNFNQAMVRAHLLKKNDDCDFQIGVIEEAMHNFHRYLFLMPILSQQERWVHAEIERGMAPGADEMSKNLAGLFKRGYGDAMQVDEQRDGITWAQFSHFYADFYVYQYASGIAAANALADTIVKGDTAARDKYLAFLATGGSKYPLDALQVAGIDMTSPEPMDRAFKVLEGFVDRLDKLV